MAYTLVTPLPIDGTVLNESADLVILGVKIDAKITLRSSFALFSVLQLRGLVS